ncbi:MAG TPA: 3-hydroxyacyl-CoA dehydrogenase, partial [Aliiroseovarius sp.]|nr:3-hydroxyacyl-CoA dehydrogenase [Aliiroseovarius sp.]
MGNLVTYQVRKGVAILTINHPPVNALGADLRKKLMRRVERAEGDPAVRAIVIRAAGRTFPVGADVREFGLVPQPPLLPALCDRIEAAQKPVVVAIHGNALGGGLEIALAGHYRIADARARLGLPEVLLGILPGAGGTQRTPRLTGARPALDMMLSGKPISAQQALKIGLIDRISGDDLAKEATAWAHELAEAGAPPRRSRDQRVGFADPDAYLKATAERRQSLQNNRLPAPARIVECVEAALLTPFDTGLAMERAAFEDCVTSDEAAALRHAFFAERLVGKVPELERATARDVDQVGVVGAGLMGAGIALVCLDAGLAVTLVERNQEALEAGLARIEKLYARAVTKGLLGEKQMAERMGRL